MNTKVDDYLKSLIGRKCWGYSAGYPTASEVFLHIGDKVLREKPFPIKTWKYGLEKYHGEYCIGIFSEWRLQTKKRPITGSYESNHKEGPMLKGLEKVINKKITDIKITDECGDLFIAFGSVYMKVFCTLTGNDDEDYRYQHVINWGLYDKVGLPIRVEKGCKIVFDNKNAIKTKEHKVKPEKA